MRFTDRGVKALKPRDTRYEVFEDGRKGLGLRSLPGAGSPGSSSTGATVSYRASQWAPIRTRVWPMPTPTSPSFVPCSGGAPILRKPHEP